MKELEIFAQAAVIRDSFEARRKQLEKRREEERKEIFRTYRPGAASDAAKAESKNYFEREMSSLREKCRNKFDEAYQKVVMAQKARVNQQIREKDAELFRVLDSLPMSESEFRFLVEAQGNRSYWFDRKLEALAERNGIDAKDMIDPSVGTVMEVLNNLKERVTLFLDAEGEERESYAVLAALHDTSLSRLENALVAGADPGFSPEKKAKKLLHEAASSAPNVVAQAQNLASAYRTASEPVQLAMITEIESGKIRLYEEAVKLSGIDYDGAKAEAARQRTKAIEAAEKLTADDSFMDFAKAIYAAGGMANPFLREAFEKKLPNNEVLRRTMDALSQPDTAKPNA